MAGLKLENINKIYGENVHAVKDLTLEIIDKEFIVFVGPSGCGKSTTLRMIAGLEDITSGNLYIGDTLVNDYQPKDRDISMVFQNYALYPHLDVFENIAFGLNVRKLPKKEIEEKVNEAATILGIKDLLKRKPRQLSGGQKQRVALARSIVRNPQVFLMDEPLSNLDAKLRTQTRAEIIKLHNHLQTTFIYVTHDQIEALTMADRIVIMNDGQIQQVDTPDNLYNNPKNVFVANFIGNPPMNIIKADIIEENNVKSLAMADTIINLNDKLEEKLNSYNKKSVYLGIRPENLDYGEKTEGAFTLKVDLVEILGADKYIYCSNDNISLIVRSDRTDSPSIGDIIHVYPKDHICHLFDIESEERI